MNTAQTLDRATERLARVKGNTPVLSLAGNSAPMPAEIIEAAAPTPHKGGLGPNQLEWLRVNVGAFQICERQAIDAENHRKQLREAIRP